MQQMIRRLRNSLLTLSAALMLLISCGDKQPDYVLPLEKLEAILYDYHLAQVMISDMPSSERYKKDLYFDYVYEKHHVTQEEIDSSLVYFARNPQGLADVYANLSKRVEEAIKRVEAEDKPIAVREAKSVVGDSVDLWYDVPVIQMTPSNLANRLYSFMVPTDSNFQARDVIEWRGKVLFLNGEVDSLHNYLHLNLILHYMNDSIVSQDTVLYTTGDFSLQVTDTALVKSIDGVAYLKSSDSNERVLLMSPALMRYHRTDVTVSSDSILVDSVKVDSIKSSAI